jgi:hypothetical protein
MKKQKYLVVCRASLHGNMLARQPDLVVPGKSLVSSPGVRVGVGGNYGIPNTPSQCPSPADLAACLQG